MNINELYFAGFNNHSTKTEYSGIMYGYKCIIEYRNHKLYDITFRKDERRFHLTYLDTNGRNFTACFSWWSGEKSTVWNVDGNWIPTEGEVHAILL